MYYTFQTLEETKDVRVSKRQRRSTTSSQQDVERVTVENTKYFFHYGDKLDERIFHGPLTLENYKKRFHHLLCWEEKEHVSILSDRFVPAYSIIKPATAIVETKNCPNRKTHFGYHVSSTDFREQVYTAAL